MQPKTNKSALQADESLVTQLFSKYLAYWPLFLIAAALAIGAAYTYLRYTIPLYEATATLIIKDEKKGNEDSKMVEQLNMAGTKKIIENEVEVLQSRTLMNEVVKNLHLYAPIYREGKIKAVSSYTTNPVTIEAANPDDLKPVGKVYLRYDNSKGDIYLNEKNAGKINEWLNTSYGRLKFAPNTKYKPDEENDYGRKFYFSLRQTKDVTKSILGGLKVTAASKLSSIINLSYRDAVPERAEDILNELIKAYNKAGIEEKNSLAKSTLNFVEERLNAVAHDLDSIEKNVQQYKASSGATDISAQSQMYLQNVSANDQKMGELDMQLGVINQVEKFVTTKGGALPSTVGMSDPGLNQMIGELSASEIEYDRLSKTVAENNPMLVAVADKINKLKPAIMSNIQSQKNNIMASRSNLSATTGKFNGMLSNIPQKERQLVEMSRDQNIKNGIYSFLLQKREESELSYASTLSDSRVVNSAQSSRGPVSPNKMLIYIAAMAVAGGACILFISAREAFSRKVLYRKDLEALTNVTILGEVAYNKSNDSILIEAGKRSFIAEEFRKMRVSLHFLGINAKNKTILVTSSIPGEGKSFVAANLAISQALTGKKVVLVDLDLHKPSLGKLFDKHDEQGVSDYLVGESEAEDIINRIPAYENLFFVSAGTLQANPSELLVNGKIEPFIEHLKSIFDVVIIDTAPVILVTDAFILTDYCDATLYVVRHKYTPKMIVKRIDENMRINPLKNPALIFNGVKVRGFFKNNYGYGYDYVYGGKETRKEKKERKEREAISKNYN
ncbi:tyrosine-protein kinase [Ferruginibacter sp. HRS2-29]|uniref:GumC family protein n=1 Tax=Ferruginibacter sp. HRS2-29 TaxID=2487334 RepID=UPI0020CB705D|nr:tyrosine-protein kinase [Ferruginibacter sp. HRS2-29]MCP9751057.1 polysaccharide biosynthesis tyrosine autokinase [Ferruginibacter sp. HRS2-29]